MIIAVIGVATTMALSVVERTREFGLLRALGLSRGGLRVGIALESTLYGLVGSMVGIGFGLAYGVLALRATGVPFPLAVPVGGLLATMVLVSALSTVAGLLPSRRPARTSPTEVLAAT